MKDEYSKSERRKKVKSSIAVMGLISTGGLFIAKMIGLLYSMPLSSILASDELMSYYGTAYLIYSYTLNVFTAGFPFAVSTIVAKYAIQGDYKALKNVKSLSRKFIGLLGFAGMILLFLLAEFMAPLIAAGTDAQIMKNTLRILSLAIFFVPILSSYRGFWEGRKEMGEYALSQTFEQIFRVGFLLTAAYLVVYVFNIDRTFALYAAVMSTSVAAVAGIIQIFYFDRKNFPEIQAEIDKQTKETVDQKTLMKELVLLSIPFLLTAVIGYADDIYNSILIPLGLKLHGYTGNDYSTILSAFNYVGYKLTSIPQVLAPGFTAALIPHITEYLEQKKYDRASHVAFECIGIVIFIGAFLSCIIAVYAEEACHILYYTSNFELSASVIKWVSLDGFFGTLCPVLSSLMMALRLRKQCLRNLFINAVIKGILKVPLIGIFGFPGAAITTIIAGIFLIAIDLYAIIRKFSINLKDLAKILLKAALSLIAFALTAYFLKYLGLSGSAGSKLTALLKAMTNGSIAMIVYFASADLLGIPKSIFHMSMLNFIKSKFSARQKRRNIIKETEEAFIEEDEKYGNQE